MKYTDEQLLSRVRGLESFKEMPELLFIAVRSKADNPDEFDDKFYFFQNGKFRLSATCTTHAGVKSLKGGWKSTNKLGTAVIKSDEIYYNVYQKSDGKKVRHHKDKMPCFRQVGNLKYYRDNNNDDKVDEEGIIYEGNYSTNVHASTYDAKSKVVTAKIGGWSEGCIVLNNRQIYNTLYSLVPEGKKISLALLKEF
jgi:hypothetical protein